MRLLVKILSFLLKPSILVLIGIIMTVSSAIVSNYLLESNSLKLKQFNKDSIAIEQKIDDYWKYVESSERKIDLAVIALTNLYDENKKIIVRQYFSHWLDSVPLYTDLDKENFLKEEKNTEDTITKYTKLIKTLRTRAVNKIDDLYIEKISIGKQRDAILGHNMFLKNVALLLQILGLILVLSRNIFSH